MRRTLTSFVVAAILVASHISIGEAKGTPFSARSGVDIAADAARSWAPDARLVYLENDEPVSELGAAARWGYLFFSQAKGAARGYTVRDGKILEASDLDFELDAPPLATQWVDSQTALQAAEKKAGAKYRRDNTGRLETMLLIRGAFHADKPNATTWTLVYTSPDAPALWVVVDAADGKVVRTWRG